MKLLTAIILVALGAVGCDVPFDPVAEGDRPNVVFALLNTASDTQVVRVHSTSRPSASDPGYPPVGGASVSIRGAEGNVVYDAVPVMAIGESVDVFIAPGFVPTRGGSYQLLLEVAGSVATANATVPGTCSIMSGSSYVLREPYRQPASELIGVSAVLSREAYGFLIRLVIEYEELDGTEWKTRHREVPSRYRNAAGGIGNPVAEYPSPRRRTTSPASEGEPAREWEAFANSSYRQTLGMIYGFASGPVQMKRALFVVYQLDYHFFAYYNLANHFLDPNSIRVDRPDYSNVTNALGFFGSLTTDTLAISLPANLSPP